MMRCMNRIGGWFVRWVTLIKMALYYTTVLQIEGCNVCVCNCVWSEFVYEVVWGAFMLVGDEGCWR